MNDTIRNRVHLSVRDFVEFLLREGDIDNRIKSQASDVLSMQEGARIHRLLQKRMGEFYYPEVSLKHFKAFDNYDILIEGRADGIIYGEMLTIDEIKSTHRELVNIHAAKEVHLAQAKCYAYFLLYNLKYIKAQLTGEDSEFSDEETECLTDDSDIERFKENGLISVNDLRNESVRIDEISVRITYCNVETLSTKYFHENYTYEELHKWFNGLLLEYKKWTDYELSFKELRNNSIKNLTFPYLFRDGQKECIAQVYNAVKEKIRLFIEAPTGTGKTINTLYPSIRAMGEGRSNKIFYLTAKTITRTAAVNCLDLLREKDMRLKSVVITARDKICPFKNEFENVDSNDENTLELPESFDIQRLPDNMQPPEIMMAESFESVDLLSDIKLITDPDLKNDNNEIKHADCNPLACPYAKGHYDRVNNAIYDLMVNEDSFTRETILEYANRHRVCPFELSLDMSLFADCIICDYNYVFDPNVYLRRFFVDGASGDYIFLIDEAHNLPDRAMEMFSADLLKEDFLECVKYVKPYDKKLEKELKKCNKLLLEMRNENSEVTVHSDITSFVIALMRCNGNLERFLDEDERCPDRDKVLELYFKVRHFLNMYENMVDSDYIIYSKVNDDSKFMLKLLCNNPASNLKQNLDKGISTVFFSATLLPIQYFKDMLTGEDDRALYAKSVFDTKKRALLIAKDVSSKYTRRNEVEYCNIAEYISSCINIRKGNYLVFFPSYSFLKNVLSAYRDYFENDDVEVIEQSGYMTEEMRESFLAKFYEPGDKSLIGFCVMGGIFSEGIDLRNEALIGSIVVGTGLPMVNDERNLLKDKYEEEGVNGFDYAYRFPGMNKVMQAAGRVIRTEEDNGVILLLDERFLQQSYKKIFPREWNDYKEVSRLNVSSELKRFWKNVDEKNSHLSNM